MIFSFDCRKWLSRSSIYTCRNWNLQFDYVWEKCYIMHQSSLMQKLLSISVDHQMHDWTVTNTFIDERWKWKLHLHTSKYRKLATFDWYHLCTVWKFQDFSIIQILCEINFGVFKSSKTAVFCNLAGSEFCYFHNFSASKKCKNKKSEPLNELKWQTVQCTSKISKIDFT